MKKFNEVLALGMAGSMALSMAACGGSSSTSASTDTDGSSTSTAVASSDEVVTLKWVACGTASALPKCSPIHKVLPALLA